MESAGEDTVEVLIESARGSRNVYEYDQASARLRLNRVLAGPVQFPADYGFITETRAADSRHLDALVIAHEPLIPGCFVTVRPIGVLEMHEGQSMDHKILTAAIGDPRLALLRDLADVSKHLLREIEVFFETDNASQRIPTAIRGWRRREQAWSLIRNSRAKWQP